MRAGRAARYDRIIVTASATTVPRAWHDQLAEGGLLELPLLIRSAGAQAIVTLRKQGEQLMSQALIYGGFMPLREAPGAPAPSPPPNLSATERIDDRSRPLAHLSAGAGLGDRQARWTGVRSASYSLRDPHPPT